MKYEIGIESVGARAGQLQELAGGRRCLLPAKELSGGPPGLPLASGAGVRNHVRLCFIAYGLCGKLANEWRAKGETGEVQRLLRQL